MTRKLIRKNKGQVLVISIAVLLAIFILFFLVVETGNFMYEKVHLQNAADSGAIEGGLWYARSLNILSLSNKILLCSGIAGGIMTFCGFPDGFKAAELVRNIQDVFAGTGKPGTASFNIKAAPCVAEGCVIWNGKKNEVDSIALFNVENFSDNTIFPSFNVERTYVGVKTERKIIYSYKSTLENRIIEVREDNVQYNKSAKRWQVRNPVRGDERRRFVSRSVEIKNTGGKEEGLPLAIEENGEHTVFVISMTDKIKQKIAGNFFIKKNGNQIRPDMLFAGAMTRISGGSMSVWDVDGAGYTPKIESIIVPDISTLQFAEQFKILSVFSKNFQAGLSGNLILH